MTKISASEACETVAGAGDSRLILLCDHASNHLPADYGDLGVEASQFARHIAYDIGARDLTLGLAERLGATAVLSRFSRLLIDPNRGMDDPTLIMRLSDGAVVPGNRDVDDAERARRIARFHRPYHDAVAAAVAGVKARGHVPFLVSIHSFTPVYKGKSRSVELGILHDRDVSLSSKLIKCFPNIDARLNEPYGPKDGVLHTLNMHGFARGLAHAMIEIRNDFVSSERGQDEWAQRLSVPLNQAAAT